MKKRMMKKEVLLFVLVVFSIFILSFASATAEFNVTVSHVTDIDVDTITANTVFNFSIGNENHTQGYNISLINITLPSAFTFVLDSNGTSYDPMSNFTNHSSTVLSWANVSDNVGINCTLTHDFFFNATCGIAGNYSFNVTVFTINGSDSDINSTLAPTNISFSFNLTIYNSSNVVAQANVSVYEFIQSSSGPPTENFLNSSMSDVDGLVKVSGLVPTASNREFKIKVIQYNGSSATGNATEVGPTLPPFPWMMIKAVLNLQKLYTQPAMTFRLYATNESYQADGALRFGYEVIDQAIGFPIESNVKASVTTKDVVVPLNRSYTIMILRDPSTFSSLGAYCSPGSMNSTTCPSPPQSSTLTNLTSYNSGDRITINQTLVYGQCNLTINLRGNTTDVGIHTILPKLIPWQGFVPPTTAVIDSFDPSTDCVNTVPSGYELSCNVTVMNSSCGINYFIEVYANGTDTNTPTPYLAAFKNLSITDHTTINLAMVELIGQFNDSVAGEANTTKYKILLTNLSGSTVSGSHIEVIVNNSRFETVHYIISSITNGIFYIPLLNDTRSAKVRVFDPQYSPREQRLDLTQNSATVMLSAFRNEQFNPDGSYVNVSGGNILMRFMTYNSSCNVYNPPAGCKIGDDQDGDFNPISAMLAGKSNLLIEMPNTGTGVAGNITLYFENVDLLASGPPDAQMSGTNISGSQTASAINQAWKFGSLAPDIYDQVRIGIPYNNSLFKYNTAWAYTMAISDLYNESMARIWNYTINGTSDLPSEYSDFPISWFTGKTCTTSSTSECYIDNSSQMLWIRIPHFSGTGPSLGGVAPAAGTNGGAGGGAGGSASGGDPGTGEVKENCWDSLNVGETIVMNVNNKEIGVEKITFTMKKDLLGPEAKCIEVVQIRNISISALNPYEKPENVYKYFVINPTGITNDDVRDIKIEISVADSWLKNYNEDTLTLNRYAIAGDVDVKKWNPLETGYLEQDSLYSYFESPSPGFSDFAITAEVIELIQPELCGDGICDPENGETQLNCCVDCGCPDGFECVDNACVEKKGISWVAWIIVGILALIIAYIIYSYVISRKRRF